MHDVRLQVLFSQSGESERLLESRHDGGGFAALRRRGGKGSEQGLGRPVQATALDDEHEGRAQQNRKENDRVHGSLNDLSVRQPELQREGSQHRGGEPFGDQGGHDHRLASRHGAGGEQSHHQRSTDDGNGGHDEADPECAQIRETDRDAEEHEEKGLDEKDRFGKKRPLDIRKPHQSEHDEPTGDCGRNVGQVRHADAKGERGDGPTIPPQFGQAEEDQHVGDRREDGVGNLPHLGQDGGPQEGADSPDQSRDEERGRHLADHDAGRDFLSRLQAPHEPERQHHGEHVRQGRLQQEDRARPVRQPQDPNEGHDHRRRRAPQDHADEQRGDGLDRQQQVGEVQYDQHRQRKSCYGNEEGVAGGAREVFDVEVDAALEEDHDEGQRREDRPHLAEVLCRDHSQPRPEDDAGEHEDEDVGDFGALEKAGQEMAGEYEQPDAEND